MRKKTKIIIGITTFVIVSFVTIFLILFMNNSPKLTNVNGKLSSKTNVTQKNGKTKNNTDGLNPNTTNNNNSQNTTSNSKSGDEKSDKTSEESNNSNGGSSNDSNSGSNNDTTENKVYSPTEKDKVNIDKQNDSTPTPVKESNNGYDIVYTDENGKETKEHVSNSDINSAKKSLNDNKISTDNMTDGFIAYKIVQAHVQNKELKDVITLKKMS